MAGASPGKRIHPSPSRGEGKTWIPACAGMTKGNHRFGWLRPRGMTLLESVDNQPRWEMTST